MDALLELVGRGRIDISCATDIARAILNDGVKHETIKKLASLGGFGSCQSHAERDLHTWLRTFGLFLEPYVVYIDLKACEFQPKVKTCCFGIVWEMDPQFTAAQRI